MALSRRWKTLWLRVLCFSVRGTGPLLENVSFERGCDATPSLHIPVDCVADGFGEAARRLLTRSFNLFQRVGLFSGGMASTGIHVRKKGCYRNSSEEEKSTTAFRAVIAEES